jgi:hypothetical protein
MVLLTLPATLLAAAPAHAIIRLPAAPSPLPHHRRRGVDPTVAHRNHIHIGLTKAGAMRRTSFWSAWR